MATKWKNIIKAFLPVSYTHLDVYKRQQTDRAPPVRNARRLRGNRRLQIIVVLEPKAAASSSKRPQSLFANVMSVSLIVISAAPKNVQIRIMTAPHRTDRMETAIHFFFILYLQKQELQFVNQISEIIKALNESWAVPADHICSRIIISDKINFAIFERVNLFKPCRPVSYTH